MESKITQADVDAAMSAYSAIGLSTEFFQHLIEAGPIAGSKFIKVFTNHRTTSAAPLVELIEDMQQVLSDLFCEEPIPEDPDADTDPLVDLLCRARTELAKFKGEQS